MVNEKENCELQKDFLSVKEACEYLTITKATFYKNVKNGLIPVVKLGGHTLVPVKELQDSIYAQWKKR